MEKQVGQRIEFWHRLYDRTWGITWRYEIGTDRIIAEYSAWAACTIATTELPNNRDRHTGERIGFASRLAPQFSPRLKNLQPFECTSYGQVVLPCGSRRWAARFFIWTKLWRGTGVGYGPWTHIDGWSEAVVEYIRVLEQMPQA